MYAITSLILDFGLLGFYLVVSPLAISLKLLFNLCLQLVLLRTFSFILLFCSKYLFFWFYCVFSPPKKWWIIFLLKLSLAFSSMCFEILQNCFFLWKPFPHFNSIFESKSVQSLLFCLPLFCLQNFTVFTIQMLFWRQLIENNAYTQAEMES